MISPRLKRIPAALCYCHIDTSTRFAPFAGGLFSLSAVIEVHMDGMPHGYCLLWNPPLLWLHAASDVVIAAAYFVIPLSLVQFVRRRPDVPFNIVFWSFGAFILLCGASHLLAVYNIWVPNWWLSGGVKAATAAASVLTAGVLVTRLPQAIALPSPSQLQHVIDQLAAANAQLSVEATEREAVQRELSRATESAEEMVRTRTAELASANVRLRDSEARYRALARASSDMVWTTDATGTPRDMTEWSRFTGVNPAGTIMSRAETVHPEDREGVVEAWHHAIATDTPFESQHRIMNADGEWRHVQARAVPVHDASGTVVEWVGAHQDVSDQVESARQFEQMQQQLQQSQRLEAVGRLAGGIAHDFNNLLTVITGTGALVLENLPAGFPLSARRDIEDIVAAGTRAAALTAQLLAYSRKQVLQPQLLDVGAVLDDVQTMLRRLIGENIDITVARRDMGWHTLADPNQLEQVIVNLALNARDAMPHGGTITFETEKVLIDGEYSARHLGVATGEYVMLAVSDTGVGMDDITRAQIFEPFFTTKPLGAGTGLGLATVYGVVRQSGGHIYVYSEPQLGTTFKIYLPRAADGIAPDAPAATVDAAAASGGETVLLVEDSRDVREFVARVLRRFGYDVREADSPDAALALIESDRSPIDLLLSDVIMPGINGRELADIVVTRRPGVAVLFMSGYTDNAIIHHGVLDPRTNFLHKPFTPDQLLSDVRRALAERSERQRGA